MELTQQAMKKLIRVLNQDKLLKLFIVLIAIVLCCILTILFLSKKSSTKNIEESQYFFPQRDKEDVWRGFSESFLDQFSQGHMQIMMSIIKLV